MQFLVLGYDGKDDQALNRRKAAREHHMELGKTLKAEGKVLYAVAMLNDQKEMFGSVYVVDFEDRAELNNWLKIEPYVTGNVWQKIEVTTCQVPPSFLN